LTVVGVIFRPHARKIRYKLCYFPSLNMTSNKKNKMFSSVHTKKTAMLNVYKIYTEYSLRMFSCCYADNCDAKSSEQSKKNRHNHRLCTVLRQVEIEHPELPFAV